MQGCRVRVLEILAPSMLTLLRTALFHGFKQTKNKKQNIAAPFDKNLKLGLCMALLCFLGLATLAIQPSSRLEGAAGAAWRQQPTIMVTGDHSVLANIFLLNSRNIASFFVESISHIQAHPRVHTSTPMHAACC